MNGVHMNKVEKALRELNERLALQQKEQKSTQKIIGEICFQFDLSPIEEKNLRQNFQKN